MKTHLEALEFIEDGALPQAAGVLEALIKRSPDYVPALLELALLRERAGHRKAARPLFKALEDRLGHGA